MRARWIIFTQNRISSEVRFFIFAARLLGVAGMLLWMLTGCQNSLPACDDPLGCVLVRRSEPIELAYLLPTSGETAVLGQEMVQAIELAILQRSGELRAHELRLNAFDSQCDRSNLSVLLDRLTENEAIVGVIGPACSNVAAGVSQQLQSSGIVTISPAATAVPRQLADSVPQLYFQVAPPLEWEGENAGQFARDILDAETAVVLYDDLRYSQLLRQTFVVSFQQNGGTVIEQELLPYTMEEIEQRLSSLIELQPDLIFMPLLSPELNLVTNKLLEIGRPDSVRLLTGEAALDPDLPLSAGTAVNGLYIAGTAVDTPFYQQWLDTWEETYLTPPTFIQAAYAYDATNLLLDAIDQVAISDGRGALLIGRQALAEAIVSADQFGVTSQIRCQADGNCTSPDLIGVYQVREAEINGRNWPPTLIWRP